MNDAQKFLEAARSFRGAKWQHLGRTPIRLDCIGIIALAAQRAGFFFEDETCYPREPHDDRLRKGLIDRFGEPLSVKRARPGDIALYRHRKGEPSHVGIVGDHPNGLSLIHVHLLYGVIEQGLRDHILASVIEVYRPEWKHVD
jgi:cell wall-associated NlpC family hydrolase